MADTGKGVDYSKPRRRFKQRHQDLLRKSVITTSNCNPASYDDKDVLCPSNYKAYIVLLY